MWKHVLLLGIVHIGGQGGLGHWGRLGAPIFTLTTEPKAVFFCVDLEFFTLS